MPIDIYCGLAYDRQSLEGGSQVVTIKRQPHGIRVEQTTITISGDEMARLRREARAKGITVSRHVVNMIRLAWSVEGALGTARDEQAEHVA
jgi:hypothetical protein